MASKEKAPKDEKNTAKAAPEAAKDEKQEATDKPVERVFEKEELLPIIDSLLQYGYAVTSFKIKEIPVVLKTRFGWEDQIILKKMKESDTAPMAFRREFSFWSMAAAIVQFGSHRFEPINDTDLEAETLEKNMVERYNFMRSLNSIFLDIVERELVEFDAKQDHIARNYQKLMADF